MHVHAIPGRGMSKSELFAAFGRARAQGWQIQPLGLHEAVLRHPDGREFRLLARGEGKGRKRCHPISSQNASRLCRLRYP